MMMGIVVHRSIAWINKICSTKSYAIQPIWWVLLLFQLIYVRFLNYDSINEFPR